MTLAVIVLKLTWLALQLVDTLKVVKKPSPRKGKIRVVNGDDEDINIAGETPRRTRMSTLKRDQWRRLLKAWIVWIFFSYAEAIADGTIGMVMPFYNQVKIVCLLCLSIPRSSTLPFIYDRFLLPKLKKYSRTIDLTTSLLVLVGQYLLQLVLCATVVPVLTTFEKVRSFWRGRSSTDTEPDVADASIVRLSRRPSPPPPPGGFGIVPSGAPSSQNMPRKKPRKSVLDNVLEFSLGTPRTLRQTVHEAKALYEGPTEKPGKKSGDGPSRLRLQAEQAGGQTKDGLVGSSKKTTVEGATKGKAATSASLNKTRAVPVQSGISVGPSRQAKTQTMSRSVAAERDLPRPGPTQASRQLPSATAAATRAVRATVPDPLAFGIPTLPTKSSLKAAGPSRSLESLPQQNVRAATVPPVRSAVAGPSQPITHAQPGMRHIEAIEEDLEDMQGVEYTDSAEPIARAVSAVGGSSLKDTTRTVTAQDAIAISGKSTPRKRKQVDTTVEASRPKARKVERPSGSLDATKQACAAPRTRRLVETSVALAKTATKPQRTVSEAKPMTAQSANVLVEELRMKEEALPEGRTLRSARRKAPADAEVAQLSPDPAPEPEPEIRRPKPRAVPPQQPVKRATRPQRPEHR